MFAKPAKVLVAALALAGTSLAFAADAAARPIPSGGWSRVGGDTTPQERHDPTNTNGF